MYRQKSGLRFILPTATIAIAVLSVVASRQSRSQINPQLSGPPGPAIVGPGIAPNVGVPVNTSGLAYYGGYADPDSEFALLNNNFPRVNRYGYVFGQNDVPQTTSRTSVRAISRTQLAFQWDGDIRAISSILVETLDKSGTSLTKHLIVKTPTTATIRKSATAVSYRVTVSYINGLTNTVSSTL